MNSGLAIRYSSVNAASGMSKCGAVLKGAYIIHSDDFKSIDSPVIAYKGLKVHASDRVVSGAQRG